MLFVRMVMLDVEDDEEEAPSEETEGVVEASEEASEE